MRILNLIVVRLHNWSGDGPGKKPGGMIDFNAFKSPAYSVYCASGFFCFLGIYTRTFVFFIYISYLHSQGRQCSLMWAKVRDLSEFHPHSFSTSWRSSTRVHLLDVLAQAI